MENVTGPPGEVGVKLGTDEPPDYEVMRAYLVIFGMSRPDPINARFTAIEAAQINRLSDVLEACFKEGSPAVLYGSDINFLRQGLTRAIELRVEYTGSRLHEKAAKRQLRTCEEMLDGLNDLAPVDIQTSSSI